MNRIFVAIALIPLTLAGCKKAETEQAAAAASAAASASAAAALAAAATPVPTAPDTAAAIATAAAMAAAPAPGGAGDLATAEDFEQQALDEINPQNLEKELDTLEEQIGK